MKQIVDKIKEARKEKNEDKHMIKCEIKDFDLEIEPGVTIKVHVIAPKNLRMEIHF